MPAGGPYTGRFVYGRLTLGYDTVDVPRLDPESLLAGPLAPLALWSSPEPDALVETVVERIAAIDGIDRQRVLVELAILRGDRVAVLIRDALERKKMGNVLEGTELGNALIARGEALGEARGEARGRVSGRAELLRAVLVDRFGEVDGVDEVVASLAGSGDAVAVVKRIHAAAALHDLMG